MVPLFVLARLLSLNYCHNTLGGIFQDKIPMPTVLCLLVYSRVECSQIFVTSSFYPQWHNHKALVLPGLDMHVWHRSICVRIASIKQPPYCYRLGHHGRSSLLYLHLFFTWRLGALGKPPFLPRRPNRQCLLILQASVRYASKKFPSHFPIKETLNYRRSSPIYIHV